MARRSPFVTRPGWGRSAASVRQREQRARRERWLLTHAAWAIRDLFKNGEAGAAYDPSQIAEYAQDGAVTTWSKVNMYQDAAGTVPVLAAGDPVGLLLDTRLGLARGANNAALEGTWQAGSGGTVTHNNNGSVTFTADTLSATSFTNTGGTQSVAGQWYECAITVDSTNATTLSFGPDGDDSFAIAVGDNAAMVAADNGSVGYPVVQVSAGHTATISAASVVHVAGNHASQVTSAARPTYQTDGKLHWLKFDGVDDVLVTPQFDAGIDKLQVFSGLMRDTTSTAIAAEFGTSNSDHGHFYLTAPEDTTAYGFLANGAAVGDSNDLIKVGYSVTPETVVLTGLSDTSQGVNTIRKNGASGGKRTTVDAGSFGNHKLHIGARGGASFPLSGNMYGLIVRFADPLADADIESAEAHLAEKSGVTL